MDAPPIRLSIMSSANGTELSSTGRPQDTVVLADELPKLLGQAALHWAGVPDSWIDSEQVIKDLSDLIVGSGSIGPRHWRARRARKQLDTQFADVIRRARGLCALDEDAPLARLARFRNEQGLELSLETAAVELNNLVRPVVAVSWFITALARDWHMHHEARRYVERGSAKHAENFVQETRRTYPFFPFVAARTEQNFQWKGQDFAQGSLVLLDLYGTNHYERVWSEPDRFDPGRFESTQITLYNFIPQGGGDHFAGHRCAGEWVTLSLMKLALRKLRELQYSLVDQDLSLDENHMPARIRSGVILSRVRPRNPARTQVGPAEVPGNASPRLVELGSAQRTSN